MVDSETRMLSLARPTFVLAGLVAILLSPNWVSARTWNVLADGSGDAPTVQAGIDTAATGDTVLVHPGIYAGKLSFRGRDIVVRSSAGPEQTILDGTGFGVRVVTFSLAESRSAIIEGFTITHGTGGILVFNSEPSIVSNIITENQLPQDGGGIWCDASTFTPWFPLIKGNTITNNRSQNLAGGVGTLQRMVPEIVDNYIANNEARDGDGGGIYYRSFDDGAVIRGNSVVDNHAGDHAGGIYVSNNNSVGALDVEVSWNLVRNNSAQGSEITGNSGGGIWLWQTQAWIHHNTIVENTGNGPTNDYGGGLVIEQPGSPTIEQNIIAFNKAGGGIWCGNGATPVIRNNLAWQNLGSDGVRDCPSWWQSNGNIIDNPYFCDMAAGDFTVASNSGVMTHPAGPLGAFGTPGCGPVAVQHSTWGSIKARYLSSH